MCMYIPGDIVREVIAGPFHVLHHHRQKEVLAEREKQLKMERLKRARQAAAKNWQSTLSSKDTPAAVPVPVPVKPSNKVGVV